MQQREKVLAMIQNPRFKKCFLVELIPPDEVLILGEKFQRYQLKGRCYFLVASQLLKRKKLSVIQMIEKLQKELTPPEVYWTLIRFEENDLIEEEQSKLLPHFAAFCNLINCSTNDAIDKLHKTPISLYAIGSISKKTIKTELQRFPFHFSPLDKLMVVFSDDFQRKKLRNFHLKSLKEKKPWMLVKTVGAEIWIGPLFIPYQTGCFDCLLTRLRENSIVERYIEKKKKRKISLSRHLATLPSAEPLAIHLAANELFKWMIQGSNSSIEGSLLSYDSVTAEITVHRLIRKPQCPSCGNSSLVQMTYPIDLKSGKSMTHADGGYRLVSAEETFKKFQHHISPITGVITHFKSLILKSNSSIHSYAARFILDEIDMEKGRTLEEVWTLSGGKGKSDAQAKTSCLCEALERYSGVFRGDEQCIKGSYEEFKGKAIHPASILLFSEKQYALREAWNCTAAHPYWIPSPFNEQEIIDWSPVWSLSERQEKWVPTAFCYFAYPFKEKMTIFCNGNSNGCAAGNTLEEAILQGFFELVERDAVALWWYPRVQRQGVDLQSFKEPYIDHLIDEYAFHERELWAIDLMTDLSIPCFAAFSRFKSRKEEAILMGFGAHFDPHIALLRALTEMNQSFSTELDDQMKKIRKKQINQWLKNVTVSNHSFLLPNPKKCAKQLSNYPNFVKDDIKENILLCQKIVESKNMEMLVLNQTRLEIGLPVVRVIVPGLRHFWNRFAPGRLYDIPYQLGFMDEKIREEDLNPIPMFL